MNGLINFSLNCWMRYFQKGSLLSNYYYEAEKIMCSMDIKYERNTHVLIIVYV